MTEIADILDFWFSETARPRWFKREPDFDREIGERFEATYERAAAGELGDWKSTPEGCLALVILLDQLPRNMYRGDCRAYATDAKARAVFEHALEQGFDERLTEDQRLFLYLPFEHSENLDHQRRFRDLVRRMTDDLERLEWGRRHYDIIERFGRFPHRNAILGRETTPEEAEILARGAGPSKPETGDSVFPPIVSAAGPGLESPRAGAGPNHGSSYRPWRRCQSSIDSSGYSAK